MYQKIIIAVAASLVAVACSSKTPEDALIERIKPVGTVCVEGDDCAKSLTVAQAGAARSAEEIYNTGCLACHATGAAGAPKFRDAADWEPRLAAGKEALYGNAINGKGGMPPKGLCPACSDDEIKSVVDYMIEGL
jgi:cytochrome c5